MDGLYSGEERRRFERFKINVFITFEIDKPTHLRALIKDENGEELEEAEAVTLDLSEGGMAILTKYDIPPESLLSMEFMLYATEDKTKFTLYKSIKAKGEVKSSILLERDKHRLGVYFKEISEEDKDEIADFVKKGITPKKPGK